MEFCDVITVDHQAAPVLGVMDANGCLIHGVRAYNNVTKEIEVYERDENGNSKMEWNNPDWPHFLPKYEGQPENERGRHMVTKKYIAAGSRIVFKNFDKIKKNAKNVKD